LAYHKKKDCKKMTGYQQQTIYAEIPTDHGIDDDEAAAAVVETAGGGGRARRGSTSAIFVGKVIAVMVLLGLVLSLLVVPSAKNQGSAAAAAGKGNLLVSMDHAAVGLDAAAATAATRACTFDECIAARCDHSSAPFTCLFHNGGPHGGCSSGPWTADSCSESCTLAGCDALDMPDDLTSCHGVFCGPEWCQIGQLCGASAPYQCQDGAGRFGCSADAYHWVLYNGCPAYCDTTTCGGP
jgi:hypothetical protein